MRQIISKRLAPISTIGLFLTGASAAFAQQEPAIPVEPPPPEYVPPPVEAAPLPEAPPPAPSPEPEREEQPTFKLQANVGLGLRAELVFDPKRAGADDPVYTVNHNLRPYFNGQVHEYIKFEGNLDSNAGSIVVLDAILKLEFDDLFNIWLGRFLTPSDRANLSGPYFQNAWFYPSGVHSYTSVYAGRDDGIAILGQINGGQFKWQLGAFDMGGGTPDPRLAARLTLNLLDPEPGYYNSSTYYGTKDVLAIGGVLQYEPAPEGAADEVANTLWNLDALFEKNFRGAGVLDLEGAFYGFDGNDTGTSFFLLGSFVFEPPVGFGQLQPMVRVQRAGWSDGDSFPVFGMPYAAPADDDASLLTIDAGLHYIINGHNALLAFTFTHARLSVGDEEGAATNTVFTLGGQIQAF